MAGVDTTTGPAAEAARLAVPKRDSVLPVDISALAGVSSDKPPVEYSTRPFPPYKDSMLLTSITASVAETT
jgi:hypothetical protein